MMKESETLDRLYLEWSQYTGARTARELAYREILRELREVLGPDHVWRVIEALGAFDDV